MNVDKTKSKFETLKRMAMEVAFYRRLTETIEKIEKVFSDKLHEWDLVIDSKIGPKGDTPTNEELLAIIEPLIPQVSDGHTPTDDELLALIRPLIPKVENGHTPTNEELLALIRPLIPQVKDGVTPIKGVDYFTDDDIETITKEVRSSITIPKIKAATEDDLLHIFTRGKKKLSVKHIDGLEQTLASFSSQLGRGYLHGGGDTIKAGTNIVVTPNQDGTKTVSTVDLSTWTSDVDSGGFSLEMCLHGAEEGIGITPDIEFCIDGGAYGDVVGKVYGTNMGGSNAMIFSARTNNVFAVQPNINLDSGVVFSSINSDNTAQEQLEVRSSQLLFSMFGGQGAAKGLGAVGFNQKDPKYFIDIASGGIYDLGLDDFVQCPDIGNSNFGWYINDVSDGNSGVLIPGGFYWDGSGNVTVGSLNVQSSLRLKYRATTTTTTLDATDHTVDCTSGTFTVNLPTATGIVGMVYNVKNSGTGTITVDASGSELIDGQLTQAVQAGSNLQIQCTGSGWIII